MNRERVSEILAIYRPGEGLESDPEVGQALQLASADPELASLRRQMEAFDQSVARQLRQIPVPAGLQQQILEAARAGNAQVVRPPASLWSSWLHVGAFAAAAGVIILLALSFTFWSRPEPVYPRMVLAESGLMQTAHALYNSLSPSYKSRDGSGILEYLKTRGGVVPASLPGNIAWDKSFACDVVEVDGRKVSIICFTAPDNSRSMHLFTFHRADFPDFACPGRPTICSDGGCCCAAWGDEDQIHVLFSDKGVKNLLAVLDI